MVFLSIAILFFLTIYLIFQVVLIIKLVIALRLTSQKADDKFPYQFSNFYIERANSYLPKATVILSLRGEDPFLADCLTGLLKQNYPSYDIQIVIDSESDPAWQVVNQVIQKNNPSNISITVSCLANRLETCSLKCSAIIQAISQLDEECEIIALADSDMIPPKNWLGDLVLPLTDPRIGVTTGNRWYAPLDKQWGSLARFLWNYSVVSAMYVFGFPWAGSLAFRRKSLKEIPILQAWKNALSDDVTLASLMHKHGKNIYLVPSLFIVNREECDMGSFFSWANRQQLSCRLHSPLWNFLFFSGLFLFSIPLITTLLLFSALMVGKISILLCLVSGLLVYYVVIFLLLYILDCSVYCSTETAPETSPLRIPTTIFKVLLMQPLMPLINLLTLVNTARMHKWTWRGVQYRIQGNRNIQLVKYQPYESLNQAGHSKVSID